MPPRLRAVLGDDDRLMPHLHLSAQHGDDLVLKQMKRRHLARDVVRFCDEARRRRSDIVFGADIIAGFPTETEDAHNATRQMIHRAGITYLHVFPFSPRTGTPAARMRPIDGDTIRRRARDLREDGTRPRTDTHRARVYRSHFFSILTGVEMERAFIRKDRLRCTKTIEH